MFRFFFSLLLLTAFSSGFTQLLQADVSGLLFQTTNERDTLKKEFTVSNPADYSITVSEIRFYDTYQRMGFSSPTDTFTLQPGDSQRIEVFFHPKHNVNHNSELVLIAENGLGATAIDLRGQGEYSMTYYSSTQNLSEQALKDALKSRLSSGQVSFSYSEARNFMYESIDNQKTNGQGAAVNTLECVYTGTVITGYANRSAAQNMGFNTEHTFPQSLFNQNLPMRSDLFHLFPTTQTSNSVRANLPFGTVSNPSWQVGGSRADGAKFEPRDVHKGKVARAMFYFVLRYSNYSNFLNSQEGILRQWHETYLPTEIDSTRNEDIFFRQRNRNPFVDYPQFINRISSLSGNSVASEKSLDLICNEAVFPEVSIDSMPAFSYVLVNDGRLPVSLSNFSSSSADFGISQGDTVLEAGEALSVEIQLLAQQPGTTTASLNFQTDVSGLANVQVPLSAQLTATHIFDGPFRPMAFSVVATPEQDKLIITPEEDWNKLPNIRLIDLGGREQAIRSRHLSARRIELDIRAINSGLYVLMIEGKGTKKIGLK